MQRGKRLKASALFLDSLDTVRNRKTVVRHPARVWQSLESFGHRTAGMSERVRLSWSVVLEKVL